MPNPNNRGRTRRSGLLIVGISAFVLIAAAATLVAIVGWKSIKGVFAKEKASDGHPGKIAVVVSPVAIPAFTAIDPAIFIDPRTGDFHVAWVTEKIAQDSNLIRDPGPMRGRVLKRDKAAGLTLSEADFYPRGTASGPTAGIEPGYRGVRLSSQKVDGLTGLKRFDRFDLVAVIDTHSSTIKKDPSIVMSPEAAAAAQSAKEWQTERRTLVQNARILEPVMTNRASGNVSECFVAIREEEIAALTDAIARGAKIIVMARSGLPGGDMSPASDDVDGGPALDSIRVISGNNSWEALVPANKSGTGMDVDATDPVPEPKK